MPKSSKTSSKSKPKATAKRQMDPQLVQRALVQQLLIRTIQNLTLPPLLPQPQIPGMVQLPIPNQMKELNSLYRKRYRKAPPGAREIVEQRTQVVQPVVQPAAQPVIITPAIQPVAVPPANPVATSIPQISQYDIYPNEPNDLERAQFILQEIQKNDEMTDAEKTKMAKQVIKKIDDKKETPRPKIKLTVQKLIDTIPIQPGPVPFPQLPVLPVKHTGPEKYMSAQEKAENAEYKKIKLNLRK